MSDILGFEVFTDITGAALTPVQARAADTLLELIESRIPHAVDLQIEDVIGHLNQHGLSSHTQYASDLLIAQMTAVFTVALIDDEQDDAAMFLDKLLRERSTLVAEQHIGPWPGYVWDSATAVSSLVPSVKLCYTGSNIADVNISANDLGFQAFFDLNNQHTVLFDQGIHIPIAEAGVTTLFELILTNQTLSITHDGTANTVTLDFLESSVSIGAVAIDVSAYDRGMLSMRVHLTQTTMDVSVYQGMNKQTAVGAVGTIANGINLASPDISMTFLPMWDGETPLADMVGAFGGDLTIYNEGF